MSKRLMLLVAMFVAMTCAAWADEMTMTGTVSDSHCGAKHAVASDAAAGCVANCVKGGAKYVLVSDGKVYNLDSQEKFAAFAGKSVTVNGDCDGTSIKVNSVEAAK